MALNSLFVLKLPLNSNQPTYKMANEDAEKGVNHKKLNGYIYCRGRRAASCKSVYL